MACKCACCSGACCLPDGSCQVTTCWDCQTQGGQYQGHGTQCSGASCPCSPAADYATCHSCVGGVSVSYCAAYCCAGVCQDTPCEECDQTADCSPGSCCIDAICVPCQPCEEDADCPTGQCCVDGACVECQPCCVIDGTPDFTKTEEECVSYCTLDGSVVSAADQAACESQYIGHCELDGETTGDTEVNCTGGHCHLGIAPFDYVDTSLGQSACETTYRGCQYDTWYEEGAPWIELDESQCVDGALDPHLCVQSLTTGVSGAGDCPTGWLYGDINGTPTCYLAKCVTDCDDCTAWVSGANVDACTENSDYCGDYQRTKKYGLWHSKTWIVDHYGVWHAATWYEHCPDGAEPYAVMSVGPGTELKRLLERFGIRATKTCKCNKMAKQMNAWGAEECLSHIEEIVDVMEEEARRRGLLFLRSVGRLLVRKAVRNARGQ